MMGARTASNDSPRRGLFLALPLFLVLLASSPFLPITNANIVYNNQISTSYDFIIVGGGLAGLVLASRLSEDSNHTVLVLEAGASGDAVKEQIDVPDSAYFSSLLGSSNDWAFVTEPQAGAGGRSLSWPRGKVLGGSTAVNGMYLVRPSDIEVNTWQALLNNGSGSTAWGWDNLFTAMKKSETFTPPTAEVQQAGAIQYDINSHGTTGPLHYSYPGFLLDVENLWTATLNGIGIPPSPDAMGGKGTGAFVATSAINPSNWTRSHSRAAYIDPLPPRANLDILPNATVTRVIFGGNATDGSGWKATAVEWTATGDGTNGARKQVKVNKEVILAGGTIGSPHVLMHSGVGPADVLKSAGVALQHNLPGVGQHLQDHISTAVVYKTTAETTATLHNGQGPSVNATTAELGSLINSATGYANITNLLGNSSQSFHDTDVNGALQSSLSTLVPSTDPTVIAGYKAIYQATADQILLSSAGQVELLFALTGSSVGGADSITLQAALQHPYSQGRLWINSSDPFEYPLIDPAYLSHPADLTILREGLKLARTLGLTQPLSSKMGAEVSPGSSVVTDADWDAWIPNQIGTEYHPTGSCAMLPLELGGVVDPNLKVYGLSNVRVVDASVYPIHMASHLMAPTYGLAELAAEIIRAQYNIVTPPTVSQTSATASFTSPATTAESRKKGGAAPRSAPANSGLLSTAVGASCALLGLIYGFA